MTCSEKDTIKKNSRTEEYNDLTEEFNGELQYQI